MIRIAVGLATLLIAARAAAAPAPDFATLVANCASPDPRIAIGACSTIIAAGDAMGAARFTALTQRANAELTLNSPDLAITDDTAALAINPQNGRAFETRGRAYDLKSNFAQATADEMRAVELLPQDPEALYWLGAFEADAGSYKKSVVDETKAITLAPRYADAYMQRAEDEERIGNLKADLNDLNTAVMVAPNYANAYILLGDFYFKRKQAADSIKNFGHALELDPNNRIAKAYLGLSFEAIGDARQALPLLSAFINDPATLTDKFFAHCLDTRGLAYDDLGLHDKAIADFNEAIKVNPNDADAYASRAIVYQQDKNYKLAIDDDDMAIKINPADDFAYLGLSVTYAKQKDFVDAIAFDQKFVALDPQYGQGWNELCWDRAHANQLNAALANCQKAVSLTPHDSNIWDSYGYVCLKLHKNASAIKYYSRALVIKPAFASSLYGRALAEQALGDKTKADADRAAAIKLDPRIATSFGT